MAKVTSVRLGDELASKLEALAVAVDRPKTWIIEQAVKSYIDEQSWQVEAIGKALEDYRGGNVKLEPHEQVMERLESRLMQRLDQRLSSASV